MSITLVAYACVVCLRYMCLDAQLPSVAYIRVCLRRSRERLCLERRSFSSSFRQLPHTRSHSAQTGKTGVKVLVFKPQATERVAALCEVM